MSKVCLTDIAKLDGMSEWRILKFSDCIKQINTGLNPRKNFSLGHGKNRYITAKNLTKLGIIDFENCDYIDDKAKQIIHRRSDIQIGDILLSSRAPIGQSHLIKEEPSDYEIGESIFSIRVNKGIVRPDYFCLYLSSDFFVQLAAKNVTGSIIQEIRIGDLINIDVIVPPIDAQEKIANSIDMIDKKLILNNSICSDLESMAKLLYDYWFVQFDFPDENGRPYKSSGGRTVWNDELKCEIPEGWGVQPLSHFIEYSKNGDWGNEKSKKTSDICVNCFRGADFASITNDYHMTAPVRYISVENKDRLLADGDLVTEISGGSPTQATGRIGYINKGFLDRSENDMTCSNFCKAFTPYDKNYQYWLYQTWKFFYDIGAMFNYESKTTGIKNLMFDEFVTWNKVPEPNRELVLLYQKEIDLYYGKIQSLLIENQELASLRDFLLPMLMNGQIKIEDMKAS